MLQEVQVLFLKQTDSEKEASAPPNQSQKVLVTRATTSAESPLMIANPLAGIASGFAPPESEPFTSPISFAIANPGPHSAGAAKVTVTSSHNLGHPQAVE